MLWLHIIFFASLQYREGKSLEGKGERRSYDSWASSKI